MNNTTEKRGRKWTQQKELKAIKSLGNALKRYIRMNEASGFTNKQAREFTYAFCKGYLDQ